MSNLKTKIVEMGKYDFIRDMKFNDFRKLAKEAGNEELFLKFMKEEKNAEEVSIELGLTSEFVKYEEEILTLPIVSEVFMNRLIEYKNFLLCKLCNIEEEE